MKFEDIGSIAGTALHKQPEDLSEEEKVAIAVAAGCAHRMDWQTGRIHTVNPVGFVSRNGRIEVHEAVDRRGVKVRLR